MTYIEGFVCAVPNANKEAYRKHATDAAPLFKEFGVTRMVENWGDDVPKGKVTDFQGAVQAKDDEAVARSFHFWCFGGSIVILLVAAALAIWSS